MVKIPLHVGVLVASARESEPWQTHDISGVDVICSVADALGPAFNVVHFSYFLVTVILVHHGGHKFFFIISAGPKECPYQPNHC